MNLCSKLTCVHSLVQRSPALICFDAASFFEESRQELVAAAEENQSSIFGTAPRDSEQTLRELVLKWRPAGIRKVSTLPHRCRLASFTGKLTLSDQAVDRYAAMAPTVRCHAEHEGRLVMRSFCGDHTESKFRLSDDAWS